MDNKLEKLAKATAEDCGLSNYFLKRSHIFKESGIPGEHSYLLSTEWFPEDSEPMDEELNPPGAAVIDIDIQTEKVKRIIFVQDVSFAEEGSFPNLNQKEETITWIENITGLEFGRQFQLLPTEGTTMHFQAAVDNIPVFPTGVINVEFNNEGQLTLFSIDGNFPSEDAIHWEPFALTTDIVESVAKEQMQLLEVPLESEEMWKSIYSATSVFLTNDVKKVITFEEAEEQAAYVKKQIIMEWEEAIKDPFSPVEIDLSLEATEEEALSDHSTSKKELDKEDEEKATLEIKRFLQRVYPDDSGKWMLHSLRLQDSYIIAELLPAERGRRVIDRKLQVYLDSETYTALNYSDFDSLIEIFEHFSPAQTPVLTKQQAFELLRKHVEVTPVYVYSQTEDKYILCGKIDCSNGVDAVSGKVIPLDQL
ncbi:hypothetical protein [Virgibacillus halodenitrificans]|uniref:hypothetical protein n=1 Tax=Virgibacillus halodenitrificans TaxID=1482 RepID=UPI002DB5A3B0|nr:hypothetical protein [Virgibacillus halodenitrificans]MEC2157890.1 hypothetical protein [Virgibacillus halodenitrificans]